MNVKELRQKSLNELYVILEQQYGNLFKLRLQKGMEQLSTTHLLGNTKRLIARIQTLIIELKRST